MTGAKGFVGQNLVCELKNRGYRDILEYDLDTRPELLEQYTKQCDFVFHLAGVNRPKTQDEFMTGNFGFTSELLEQLERHQNKAPVLITSSIQAELQNPYGESKKAGEDLIFAYGRENSVKTLVYRFPNLFGKWCRPNYNSVVATFCHNIARGLPIKVNAPDTVLTLAYIDDVVDELIAALEGREHQKGDFCEIPVTYQIKLGRISDLLNSFFESRRTLEVPDLSDAFAKKLYSTYLSYLPAEHFSYDLKTNTDERGSFTEMLKSQDRGQVSVNIIKPGITKGNHWHHTKNEKFLVVSGTGTIKFRRIQTSEVFTYTVSGEKLQVVDIPPGYTHNITNTGQTDMVTVMWANERFDPNRPDTFYEEV